MVNHGDDRLVRDYVRRITGPFEESDFIRSIGWQLGWAWQKEPALGALEVEASLFCELPRLPVFSLITTLSDSPARSLHELILSLRCQSYQHWELILADDAVARRGHLSVAERWAASDPRIHLMRMDQRRGPALAKEAALSTAAGEFVAFLRDTSLLHPSALGVLARHLSCAPDVNVIFSNEARLSGTTGRIAALIRKPEFDLFTLIRQNYLGNLTFIGRELLDAARRDGAVFRPEHEGVEDHDLMIRIGLTGRVKSMSTPFFLHYERAPQGAALGEGEAAPYAGEKTLALLDELLPEVYPGARWLLIPPSPPHGNNHVGVHLRELPGRVRPSLLVMIPFKDHADLTIKCLDSLEHQVHELDVRVVLIDNRSRDAETCRLLRAWIDTPRRHRYEIVEHDGPFNFARMHNAIVADSGAGDTDLLLFLNNDAELVSVDCLQTMAMQLLADDSCGFVGIRLMYPDDRQVQHGGMKIWGEWLSICGFHQVDHAVEPGEYTAEEKIAFGVTFACAMTRRATFVRLGGLEEVLFPNAYGDVALCARAVEAGMKNYYFGTLVGRHCESKTRSRTIEDTQIVALHERHGAVLTHWRLRDLSYSVLPPAGPHSWGLPAAQMQPPPPLPLRYRLADGINSSLKVALGPAHRLVRSAVVNSWRLVRAGRSAVGLSRPALRGKFPLRSGYHQHTLPRPHLRMPSHGESSALPQPEEVLG